MVLRWRGSSKDREIAMLRSRVSLLEEQVRLLARFTGIDPHHLPRRREVLGDEVQRLALSGRTVAAQRLHCRERHVDQATAARDIEEFLALHEAV